MHRWSDRIGVSKQKNKMRVHVSYIVEAEEALVSDCLAEAIEGTLEDRVVQRLRLETDLNGVKWELDKLARHTRDLI